MVLMPHIAITSGAALGAGRWNDSPSDEVWLSGLKVPRSVKCSRPFVKRLLTLSAVVGATLCACTPISYSTREELPTCGEEHLEHAGGPFNAEARECFADAIESDEPAELRMYGFDEEGGESNRTLRNLPDRAEEIVESADLGWVWYECSEFRVVEGPDGNPGFNGVGCSPR
jgi:hypothetical protein